MASRAPGPIAAKHAPVAQLDRASDYESEGRTFESFRARHFLRDTFTPRQLPMKEVSVVHSDPDILGGTPVFVGTRVPVQALIDYIEGGHSLNGFLDDFPSVTREVAIAALEQAKAHLIADARPA